LEDSVTSRSARLRTDCLDPSRNKERGSMGEKGGEGGGKVPELNLIVVVIWLASKKKGDVAKGRGGVRWFLPLIAPVLKGGKKEGSTA